MSTGGRVLSEPVAVHYCEPPHPEFRDAETGEHVPGPIPPAALTGIDPPEPQRPYVFWPRVGTLWQCDCGTVWVYRWLAGYDAGRRYIMPRGEWQRESRRRVRRRWSRKERRAAVSSPKDATPR